VTPRALAVLALAASAGCAGSPCSPGRSRLARAAAAPYVGRWQVVRADTLTLPQMGDRFKLATLALDTQTIVLDRTCRFWGRLVFSAPRAETLAVTWVGGPDEAFVSGWPADLGPFGGLGVSIAADSLRGALLFDSRIGINVTPGVTAQFVARRRPAQ
jgi:hypothetical protein